MTERVARGIGALFAILAPITVFAVTAPFISNVGITNLTPGSATVNWLTTIPADSQVFYGTTSAYGSQTTLDPSLVTSHLQTLTGLTPNTLYHYQVRSTASGILHTLGDFIFTTPPNIVQGMIGSVSVSAITGTSATITWVTNVPADSEVDYGPTTSYSRYPWVVPGLVTAHSVTLAPLAPNTLYHFRVRSIDASGNEGISADYTFTTAADQSPPFFSAISPSFIMSNEATITWTTSSQADSQVDYGTTTSYGSSTALDTGMVTAHSQTLNGLIPGTLYHYRVKSRDGMGNLSMSADSTFTTAAFSLFLPQLSLVTNSYSAIAVSNFDQTPATLNLTALDGTGAYVQGSNITNPVTVSLNAGSQLPLIVDQLFGPGISSIWPLGWSFINSSTTRLAGFFLTFDDTLSLMDGANISTSLLSSLILPETGSQDYTKLLLANPGGNSASVKIDLVKTDGTVRSTMQTSIQGFGAYTADLKGEVFPGIATDPSDYVRVTSSNGLIPYEFFGNVSRDVAVLAGQDLNGGATTLYSPQYVVGGPWNSTLSIVNLGSTGGTVTLKLVGDDGIQIGSTRTVPIAANGKIFVSDPAFFLGSAPTQVTQGYVLAMSSGPMLSGSVVFSDAAQGTFITSLPLVSTLQQSQVLSQVASNTTFFTGVAILNPNSTDATVRIDVYTSTGQLDQSLAQVLPAGHRMSRLLTDYFPALVGQNRSSGYIRVTSNQGVACFGVFGTTTLSVLSAIPAQPTP